jgi:cytochrome c biogenesis factor
VAGRCSVARRVGGALVALGVRVWSSGHLLRAVGVRARHDRAGVLARRARPAGRDRHRRVHGHVGLVGRNKRRYGGYIVHLGIVLMFLGFAGEGFKQDEQVLLQPGQQVTVGGSPSGTTRCASRATRRSR